MNNCIIQLYLFKKFPNLFKIILTFTISQSFSIILPLFIGIIIDSLIQHDWYNLKLQILIFAIVTILSKISYYKFQNMIFISRRNFEVILQYSLIDAFIKLPHHTMTTEYSAKTCAKFFRDCIFLSEIVHNFIIIVYAGFIIGLISIIICLNKNIYISIFIIFVIVIVIYIARKFQYKISKSEILYRKNNDSLWNYLLIFLQTMSGAKIMGAENVFYPDMSEKIQNNKFAIQHIDRISISFEIIMMSILSLGEFLLILISIYLAWYSIIPIGDIIVYQMLFIKTTSSIIDIFKFIPMFELAKESLKSYFEQINDENIEYENATTEIKNIYGDIKINNIDFSYKDSQYFVFKNFSLHISAGDCVAVIGANGSGKTTLFNLLLGSVQPQNGEILIDDIPISIIDKSSYRKLISVIPQHISIFNATLKDNITLKNNNITSDFNHSIYFANLQNFISRLSNGVNTKILDGNVCLSGGEKQKIAIARAIIRKSNLLMFDEITNHIDRKTKDLIIKTICRYKNKKTIILFTHDKDLIKISDYTIKL